MRRARRRGRRANHDRWLVSYADFITLLFAFFVVMYSTAQVDKRKVGKLAEAIQAAFQEMGARPGSVTKMPLFSDVSGPSLSSAHEGVRAASEENPEMSALKQNLQKALAPEIERGEVALTNGPDGLIVSLREAGFFDSGSAAPKPDALPAIDRMASLFKENPYNLRIEGHTDNVPIHTPIFASNWELSTARATEIIRILIVKEGLIATGLSASGYSEFHPIASNDTEQGRARNRRVDIVILKK